MKLRYFQILFISLVLTYLVVTFLTPIDPETTARYNLSEFQVRLIGMTISIPLALIWLVALYGYSRFHAYTAMIAQEKEGQAFKEITQGIMVLALSLPATTLTTSIIRAIAAHTPQAESYLAIGRSYVPLIMQLIAFSLLAAGAAKLLKIVKPRMQIAYSNGAMLVLIALASLFTYIVTARPFGGSVEENYALPVWLVVLTVIVPFLYAWYMGASATYQLFLYSRHVSGLVYRKMLVGLVAGLSVIIWTAIAIQVVVSISESLNRLNFTPLLIIVYSLVLLYAVGYGLLARGAQQLKKIEEV